jgi:hypothetical protein
MQRHVRCIPLGQSPSPARGHNRKGFTNMRFTKADVLENIGRGLSLAHKVLSSLDLAGVSFDGISLKGADLTGCDLSRADLRHCDLSGANLEQASLNATDLGGARLFNAIMSEADIDNTLGLCLAAGVIDAGFDPRGYRFIGINHDDGWRVKAGCRWFTMAEAERHWSRKENDDALARLNVIKATTVTVTMPAGVPDPDLTQGPGFIAD